MFTPPRRRTRDELDFEDKAFSPPRNKENTVCNLTTEIYKKDKKSQRLKFYFN